jgi:methanogenic corrinoid protein MtbC1
MSNETLLSRLTEVIIEGDKEKALALTQSALDAGSNPVEIMQVGVAQGMSRIGKMFQDFEV